MFLVGRENVKALINHIQNSVHSSRYQVQVMPVQTATAAQQHH